MSGSSSSQQPQVSTTTNEPWSQAQPYLTQALKDAGYLYKNDIGYQPWMGQTQADLNPASTDALNATEQMARQGSGLIDNTYGSLTSLMGNNGLSPDVMASLQPLQDTASGKYLSSPNPYLTDMLQAQGDRITNQVNSQLSGMGRYGSNAHVGTLTRELSNAQLPILAQNYENERQRQLSAAQGITDTYTGGLDRSLRGAAMAPSVEALRYDPANRLAGVGDFYTGRAQNDLNQLISTWDQAQSRPWDNLARFNAIASGAGQLGGTGTTVRPYSGPSTAQTAIGGAVAGAGAGSLFGPYGAALGGIGGGLLGLLA